MHDPSADLAQQKQRLRERLRFRRKHFVANLDGMARLAAFRALPQPLADILSDRGPVGTYAAWGAEPAILPMLAGFPLALPHHAERNPTMAFLFWAADPTMTQAPWGPHPPAS